MAEQRKSGGAWEPVKRYSAQATYRVESGERKVVEIEIVDRSITMRDSNGNAMAMFLPEIRACRYVIPAQREPTIQDFVARVKARAEQNMEANGTVSGAHWNAMRQVLQEMGIEAEI